MMELPSVFLFQGWTIRYRLLESVASSSSSGSEDTESLVFVHGTPWSSAMFEPVAKALLARQSYQILLYDLPGYGQSQDFENADVYSSKEGSSANDCFAGDTSVKFQAQALKALLSHVCMDSRQRHRSPAVIAHDIAGAIVLRAHLMLGCEFKSMMLCDTNAVLPWGDGFYKLARSEPKVFMDLPPGIFDAVVRAVIRSALFKTGNAQSVWEDKLALPWTVRPGESAGSGSTKRQQSFIRQISQANDQDVAEMLEGNMYDRVRCDVKLVWGEEDQWIPRGKMEDLRMRLGSRARECAFIPEAGHLVMLDQPERFAIETFAWLSRIVPPRDPAVS